MAAASQPPVDRPESTRPHGSLTIRNSFSRYGMSSWVIASPYGPTFSVFTEYEVSKYGLASRIVTMTTFDKLPAVQAS